jgi:ribose transport system permease protein
VALLLAVLSLVVGSFNGFVSSAFRINPLIVTLGAGAVITGAILVWTGGQPTGRAPAWLNAFVAPSGTTFGLPVPPILVFWAIFGIVVVVLLRRTAFGKRVYAVGASQPAARFASSRDDARSGRSPSPSARSRRDHRCAARRLLDPGRHPHRAPYLFSTIASVRHRRDRWSGARGRLRPHHPRRDHPDRGARLLVANNMGAAAQQTMLGIIILIVVASYGREPSTRSGYATPPLRRAARCAGRPTARRGAGSGRRGSARLAASVATFRSS